MGRHLKRWTALGLTALGTATMAQADIMQHPASAAMILADASGEDNTGEGGENGGEGGGSFPATYALSSTDADAFNYDATLQIAAYVELVKSSYSHAAADGRMLRQAIDTLLASPTQSTLDAARTAWVQARPAYLRTEAFRFYDGPIEEVEGEINAWPLNEAYIDSVQGAPAAGIVNSPQVPLDAQTIATANQQQDEADVTVGWHAIEFLLWGQDSSATGPGTRPYTDYIPGQGNNDRRRNYLRLATDKLVADLEGLEAAWETDDGKSLASRLKIMPQREAIGRMVNGMAILAGYEMMSERMGVALDSGDQEDEQSCFSDTTKQDFVHDLLGIRQVWTGEADGVIRPGLNDLVRAQDPALASRLDALFADAEAKINALGDPWDRVLAAEPGSEERERAEAAVTALQALSDGLVAAGNELGVIVLVPNG
jgi:putative iron-regulated protein